MLFYGISLGVGHLLPEAVKLLGVGLFHIHREATARHTAPLTQLHPEGNVVFGGVAHDSCSQMSFMYSMVTMASSRPVSQEQETTTSPYSRMPG